MYKYKEKPACSLMSRLFRKNMWRSMFTRSCGSNQMLFLEQSLLRWVCDPPGKTKLKWKGQHCPFCNFGTLNREGASARLGDVLERTKADISAMQELRCMSQGEKGVGTCDVYYSWLAKKRKFGVGFSVEESPSSRTFVLRGKRASCRNINQSEIL